MKLIGKILFGHDNGGRFFQNAPNGVLCENCQACLDPDYAPSTLSLAKFYDISETQDNRFICSERAKDFFLERFNVRTSMVGTWRGISLYYLTALSCIPFNAASRGTRFVDHCGVCGSYTSIVGATPGHLAVENLDKRCFFRTDIVFGSYEEKAPLFVVGLDTAKDIQDCGFSGCAFKDAFSSM